MRTPLHRYGPNFFFLFSSLNSCTQQEFFIDDLAGPDRQAAAAGLWTTSLLIVPCAVGCRKSSWLACLSGYALSPMLGLPQMTSPPAKHGESVGRNWLLAVHTQYQCGTRPTDVDDKIGKGQGVGRRESHDCNVPLV